MERGCEIRHTPFKRRPLRVDGHPVFGEDAVQGAGDVVFQEIGFVAVRLNRVVWKCEQADNAVAKQLLPIFQML